MRPYRSQLHRQHTQVFAQKEREDGFSASMLRKQQPTSLGELAVGSCATLASFDLPEEVQGQLMHLGFVPESRVLAIRRAPAGDPTVYRVDGTEVALRRETANLITIHSVFVASPKAER